MGQPLLGNSATVLQASQAFYGVAPSYATYTTNLAYVAANGNTLFGTVLAQQNQFSTLTDAQFSALLITNLGLTAFGTGQTVDLQTALTAYITANEVGAANANAVRGTIALQLASLLTTLEGATGVQSVYSSAAVAFNTQQSNAYTYSTNPTNTVPQVQNNTPPSIPVVSLTTGVDIATADSFLASETYFNVDGKGPTINAGDTLTGTAGKTNNTLTITDLTATQSNGNIPAGVTLNNIQNVILQESGNTSAGTGFSTVGYDSVRTLTATTNGDAVDLFSAKNGTNGTSVVVKHNGYAVTGNMNVVGGTDVTATSVGGNIVIGNPGAAARVPLATEVATGIITVFQNATGAGGVNVLGGTTVNVTVSSKNNSGTIDVGNTTNNTANVASGSIANPSAAITVNDAGTGNAVVFGGTNVVFTDTATSTAGTITVGDVANKAASNQPTGTITITETNAIAYNGKAGATNNNTVNGAIAAYGGTDVTVTTNGGGDVAVGVALIPAAKPSGNVVITATGISNATAKGAITEVGGKNVTVSTAGGAVTIGQTNNAAGTTADNPTGAISVTETSGRGVTPITAQTNAIKIDGGTTVDVVAKDQAVSIGTKTAPSGAITVTQSDVFTGRGYGSSKSADAGAIIANGGTTVTVNTTGGSVTIGAQNPNILASGAVVVKDTFGGAASDAIAVMGGTTVGITTSYNGGAITAGDANAIVVDPTGAALKTAALAPTGNVTITNVTAGNSIDGKGTATNYYGAGATNVYTNGADTVSVTGGATANVIDIQSTLATGGANSGKAIGTSKLATVVLDGFQTAGAIAVKSDALANLSLLNNATSGANSVTVTNNTAGHALTITQNNNTKALTVTDAAATSVTVTDTSGAKASGGALTLTAAKATAVTVNNSATASLILTNDTLLTSITAKGAGALTITGSEALTALTNFDATGSSGAVTFGGTAATQGFAPTGTAGVSQKFTGGSGLTTLTVSSNAISWGDSVLLTGGSGSSDVVVANYAAGGTDVAMGSGTASVKGFEFLGLGANASSAAGNYDASGFSGVTLGAVAAAVTISAAAKNASLSITAAPGFTVGYTGVTSATQGASDALTINLGTAAAGINGNTVTANGYETISIVNKGATTGNNTMTLVDTGTTGTGTLTISGSGRLTLTDATTRFSSITNTSSAVTSTTGTGTPSVTVVTGGIDVDNVTVSNAGATITGGAATLKATGASGGTEVAVITLGGTGATPFANNDTVSAVINGTTYTYTAVGASTAATMAAGLQPLIEAGRAAGATHGVVSSVSGNSIVLTKAAMFSATVFQGTSGGTGTAAASLVGGAEEQVLTLSGNSSGTGAATFNILNGKTVTIASTAGDTPATSATLLAAAINGVGANAAAIDGHDGVVSAVASGAKVVITGGTGTNGIFAAAAATVAGVGSKGIGAAATTVGVINYATANDSFTSGAGAGTYTVGLGGSWGTTTHRYSSGSETINLAASAAVVDTLKLADGRVVTNNGTLGGTTGFTVGSLSASDVLNFSTAGKTALANVAAGATVAAATGASVMAAVLDPSGALFTALGNLTYAISNGVITFSATGGHSLTEFTTAQLISAAEILANSSSTGGVNKVVEFSSGGNTYVVASDAGNTLAAGADAKDVLVQLTGVSSSTGFGTKVGGINLGAQGAVVSDTVTNVTSNAANTGSATVAIFNQAGYSVDTITAAEAGTVSTTITNLAPSASLVLGTDAGAALESITISQTGTAGLNSLGLNLANETFKSITTTGDGLLVLNPTGNATVNALIDGGTTNTLSTIKVGSGAFSTLVGAITDTALTAVDSSLAGGAVTFGSISGLTQNGVTFTLANGQNSTITASGGGDVFRVDPTALGAGGAGVVTITANGGGDFFTLTSTAAGNTVTANGAADTFTIGNTAGTGGYTITATGSGDTVTFTSTHATATTVDTGSNAVITFGTSNELIFVGGDATAGTSASYAFDTLKNVTKTATLQLDFTVAGIADGNTAALGSVGGTGGGIQNLANAQVNVASATTLAQALDLAANTSALTLTPGTDAGAAVFAGGYVYGNGILGATSGVIDWFQYGGDTYIVEAVNTTATVAAHTALGANDVVIKIAGLIDLSAAKFDNANGVLSFA